MTTTLPVVFKRKHSHSGEQSSLFQAIKQYWSEFMKFSEKLNPKMKSVALKYKVCQFRRVHLEKGNK